MALVGINTGTAANAGDGSTLRAGANIVNANFTEIYDYFGDGTNLTFTGGNWVEVATGINTLSNIGIGTTNPSDPLTVYGAANIIGVLTATRITGAAAIGVASEGTYIGTGASVINFASSNGQAWTVTAASAGVVTATVTPGASIGLAIALGG